MGIAQREVSCERLWRDLVEENGTEMGQNMGAVWGGEWGETKNPRLPFFRRLKIFPIIPFVIISSPPSPTKK